MTVLGESNLMTIQVMNLLWMVRCITCSPLPLSWSYLQPMHFGIARGLSGEWMPQSHWLQGLREEVLQTRWPQSLWELDVDDPAIMTALASAPFGGKSNIRERGENC